MNYASALVKDGVVVGGMLATPEHPSHAPALTDAVRAELEAAISALPHDGEIHVVELYQDAHGAVANGAIKAGLHINGVHRDTE